MDCNFHWVDLRGLGRVRSDLLDLNEASFISPGGAHTIGAQGLLATRVIQHVNGCPEISVWLV